MAKIQFYTIKKGDTLSKIANEQKDIIGSTLTNKQRQEQLQKLNPEIIVDIDKILAGKKIRLNGTLPISSTKTTGSTVKITNFGLQNNTESTIFATWNFGKSKNTDHYAVEWRYYTGDGVGFIGSQSDEKNRQSTYSAPSNATKVTFKVKPVSKTYTNKKSKKKKTYFTGGWSETKTYNMKSNPPSAPSSAPTVSIENKVLKMEVVNLNTNADQIKFEIVQDDVKTIATGWAIIAKASASYSYNLTSSMLGHRYKVRCIAHRMKDNEYSEWTEYSSNVSTAPNAPAGFTKVYGTSETSIFLQWDKVTAATSYDIEYATEKKYLDGTIQESDQTQTITGIEHTSYEKNGLESGKSYFFRLRAVNSSGASDWSKISNVTIGKKPDAPTTWSSTTTCITGEDLILYWVHNSEDGSSQVTAEIQLTIDGVEQPVITVVNSTDEDEKDKTSFYTLDTSGYTEGVVILWKVRTSGITGEFGDWSIQRTVDIYARPYLNMEMTDKDTNIIEVLTGYPFYIQAIPGPKTQAPIGYHLSIISNEYYETVDQIGNPVAINEGEEIYSKYFDINQSLTVELLPSNVDLENNISYTIKCTVSMNSGLTAEATHDFSVIWEEIEYEPNAEITYDSESYVTHIRPYCEYYRSVCRVVSYDSSTEEYTLTTEVINDPKGELVDEAFTQDGRDVYSGVIESGETVFYSIVYPYVTYKVTYDSSTETYTKTEETLEDQNGEYIEFAETTTGEQVFSVTQSDGTILYYCVVEINETELVPNVTLSVYRREFDGGFVELATGIENLKNTYVTDPHPALDYARYRIVSTDKTTGAVSYYDMPGLPIAETAVIIQWNEDWTTFDPSGSVDEDEMIEPPWAGSLIRLPYNIDVSDKYAPDTSLIEYIGRKRPVSYYGTQLGQTASWKVDVIKDDEDTLYALRRLAIWMGDVYVREPSGSGYWANVTVSFSQTHGSLVIPVTLDITRVEGTEEVLIETKES